VGLSLIAGPANAGKVALLLERYLAALAGNSSPERQPVLIVPNRSDVDRVERDLLRRSGALLGGSIGTFDDVFERIAFGDGAARAVVSDAQRSLLVRRIVGDASLNGLGRSARFAGFADALAAEPEGDRYLLPDVCLSGGRFLDGTTPADLPRPVEIVATDGVALRAALALA
jgi:hypothetical protein